MGPTLGAGAPSHPPPLRAFPLFGLPFLPPPTHPPFGTPPFGTPSGFWVASLGLKRRHRRKPVCSVPGFIFVFVPVFFVPVFFFFSNICPEIVFLSHSSFFYFVLNVVFCPISVLCPFPLPKKKSPKPPSSQPLPAPPPPPKKHPHPLPFEKKNLLLLPLPSSPPKKNFPPTSPCFSFVFLLSFLVCPLFFFCLYVFLCFPVILFVLLLRFSSFFCVFSVSVLFFSRMLKI